MFIADQSRDSTDSQVTTHRVGTVSLLSVEVERALRATGYPDLRGVEVALHDRVVFLRGQVAGVTT